MVDTDDMIEVEQNEDEYIEDTSYMKGNETLNYKQLVLSQINRINKLGSVELTGGYWDTKIGGKGDEIKKYVNDSREAYANAIDVLLNLLQAEIEDKNKDILEEINKIKEKFNDNIKKLRNEDGFLSDNDSFVIYSEELLSSSRAIFQKLLKFIHVSKYFKSAPAWGE